MNNLSYLVAVIYISYIIYIKYNNNIMYQNKNHVYFLRQSTQQEEYTTSVPTLSSISKNFTSFLEDIGGCDKQYNYRDGPKKNQKALNEMLAPFILKEPNIKIPHYEDIIKKGDDEFVCREDAVYTGKQLKKSRMVYDYIRFSHEMDILEARLYESVGLVDKIFVGESMYANRGHVKRRFLNETLKVRYKKFIDVIEVIDLDQCEGYMKELKRMGTEEKLGQWLWTIQGETHACMEKYIRQYNLREGVMMKTDVDEIPFRDTWLSLKYCEFRSGVVPPFKMVINYAVNGKLCDVSVGDMIFRTIEGVPMQKYEKEEEGKKNENGKRIIRGGVHMTYMGGVVAQLFKFTNHAEGGGMMLGGWIGEGYNPVLCDMSEADYIRRECLLCRRPRTILKYWEPPERNGGRRLNEICESDVREAPNINKYVPWVMRYVPDRYPCFFNINARACYFTYAKMFNNNKK